MINLWIIYAATLLGAVGVLLSLPRRGRNLSLLGGLTAAAALGIAMVALGSAGVDAGTAETPSFAFYVLSFLSLAGALRMITHPRPVYAALYFILVVLSTAGLILLLSAEFMAFALVIVYAGAILVTYLFVIMLAQETPAGDESSIQTDYDANAYEPFGAVTAGFVLLAMILTLMVRGTTSPAFLDSSRVVPSVDALPQLIGKIERALFETGEMALGDQIIAVDATTRTATIERAQTGHTRVTATAAIPDSVTIENVEALGVSLFTEFPMSLELAGVILMMAMLGAVVLARKDPFHLNASSNTSVSDLPLPRAMPAPHMQGFRIGRQAGPASPDSHYTNRQTSTSAP